MVKIKIKGHEFEAITVRDSFSRRAMQYKNNIIATLGKLGLTVDDIDIEIEANAIKNTPASVSWYFDHHHLHYSHSSRTKYVENLYVVFKVLDLEVTALLNEEKTIQEFVNEFAESHDVAKKRKEAREILGLDHDVNDLEVINKAYKDLAKGHHPDAEGGDIEKFKAINNAHKMLKRELM